MLTGVEAGTLFHSKIYPRPKTRNGRSKGNKKKKEIWK
jgi:hypothetical protein